MSGQHTPGPWELQGPRVYASGKSGPLIATTVYLPKSLSEREANTRLIAAAPDLLAALIEIMSWEENAEMTWGPKANVAIAKATGSAA